MSHTDVFTPGHDDEGRDATVISGGSASRSRASSRPRSRHSRSPSPEVSRSNTQGSRCRSQSRSRARPQEQHHQEHHQESLITHPQQDMSPPKSNNEINLVIDSSGQGTFHIATKGLNPKKKHQSHLIFNIQIDEASQRYLIHTSMGRLDKIRIIHPGMNILRTLSYWNNLQKRRYANNPNEIARGGQLGIVNKSMRTKLVMMTLMGDYSHRAWEYDDVFQRELERFVEDALQFHLCLNGDSSSSSDGGGKGSDHAGSTASSAGSSGGGSNDHRSPPSNHHSVHLNKVGNNTNNSAGNTNSRHQYGAAASPEDNNSSQHHPPSSTKRGRRSKLLLDKVLQKVIGD